MGARRNRSTESALDLLLSIVRTTWAAGGVATLLSLDMSGAFDNVIKDKLLALLHRKEIPQHLVGWVASFMRDRRTRLSFDGKDSDPLPVPAGIPQGSPISPILFLFYNSELVDLCNTPGTKALGIGFVDDMNPIAWGPTTYSTCRTLSSVHEKCLDWAA
jgi:hypothetical protein